jgi:hypothetical protein
VEDNQQRKLHILDSSAKRYGAILMEGRNIWNLIGAAVPGVMSELD